LPSRVKTLIEMGGANITVAFETPGAPQDALGAMKQAERSDLYGC